MLVGAQVVDLESPVLQADLAQSLSIEPERRNPVQPANQSGESLGAGGLVLRRIAGRPFRLREAPV